MTDLQRDLQALIAAVRTETKHSLADRSSGCTCGWQARFEAELARRWAAQVTRLRAALDVIAMRSYHGDPADYAAAVLTDTEHQPRSVP